MELDDDTSYVAIGMGLAAAGFFIVGLLRYHSLLLAFACSVFGSILGLIAAAMTLRQKELPFAATLGDMKARLRMERAKGIISNKPNWKMRGLGILAMGFSSIALFGYMLIDTHIRHLPTVGIMWALLTLGVVGAAAGVWITQLPFSYQRAD